MNNMTEVLAYSSEIINTVDFNVIKNALETADQDTLIIFDVDDVLFQPKDCALKSLHYSNVKHFEKIIDQKFTKNVADELYSIIWLQRQIELIDKKLVHLIAETQKRIKVLALTNCITGRFGQINSVEDWRIQELKTLGYSFDKSWERVIEKSFLDFPPKDSETYPCFKNGVIFANTAPKGAVLKAFLNYSKMSPKKIIFIDDNKEYLESVKEFAKATSIPYLGIHYTAAMDEHMQDFDQKRAELQFNVLHTEKKWLSDKQADLRMRKMHLEKQENRK